MGEKFEFFFSRGNGLRKKTPPEPSTTHYTHNNMFASRRVQSGGTVCFSDLDRAAQLTEKVENNRPFYEWVKANNKQPEYFANWNEVITEYYQSIGEKWTDPVPVPSPFGYLGYDFIKPPPPKRLHNERPNGEIVFGGEEPDWDNEVFLLMLETDSDSDSDEENYEPQSRSDWYSEQETSLRKLCQGDYEPPRKRTRYKSPREYRGGDYTESDNDTDLDEELAKFKSGLCRCHSPNCGGEYCSDRPNITNGEEKQPEETSTEEKKPVDQLTLKDIPSGTNIADLPEHLRFEARKLPVRSPSPSFDTDDFLSEDDEEDCLLTPQTPDKPVKKLTLEDVPPGTNLRDLPEGTRLEDLPGGCSVIINESDIEFGSEIEVSDEESDSDDDQ